MLRWMTRLLLLLSMAMPAAARDALEADQLIDIAPSGELRFEHTGIAVLANIVMPDRPAAVQFLLQQKNHMLHYESLDTDRYGRAQLIVYADENAPSLQEQMLQQGLAVFYASKSLAQAPQWLAAEATARNAKRGFWAQTDSILTPENAAQHMNQFALVQGDVTNTYRARDAYYINFGAHWQDDFSIKIPHKFWRSMEDSVDALERNMAQNKNGDEQKRHFPDPKHPITLRVRGALMEENGPMIVVTRPEQLEILSHAK